MNNYFTAIKPIALLMLLQACYGCSSKGIHLENGKELVFDKEKAIALTDAEMFKRKYVIPLETNDNSLIDDMPSVRKDGDNFFIFHKDKAYPILRFQSNGKFLSRIGSKGQGPYEFSEVEDVFVNKKYEYVEVLSDNRILRYKYDGTPLNYSKRINIPAFSFAFANNSYWFCIGNNTVASPYRLFQTDENFNTIQKYLSNKSEMLPFRENNFGGNAVLTFRELFRNQLYEIREDSLVLTYTLRFNGIELPNEVHSIPPMSVIEYLMRQNFALVRCYLANSAYIYLWIEENRINEAPIYYHWLINKNKGHEMIIKTVRTPDSYLMSPQLLTDDNLLYFIGYPIEDENETFDSEANPSIVAIDVSLFNE